MNSAVWIYPVDLVDDTDAVLASVKALGVDGISLATTYHAGRLLLPHNPGRAVHFLEDGVAYFHADLSRYTGLTLTPKVAEAAAAIDPFAGARAAADRHGLRTSAWTICLHNSRLGRQHADCTIHNAFGESYSYALCPSHPDVRAYVLALCEDIASRCRPAAIELEAFGFMSYEHASHHDKLTFRLDAARSFLLSICFCPHCRTRMAAAGLDADRLSARARTELKTYFDTGGPPQFSSRESIDSYLYECFGLQAREGLLGVRQEVVRSLLAELRGRLPADLPLHCQCAPSPYVGGAAAGLSMASVSAHVDAIIVNLFIRDEEALRTELRAARKSAASGTKLFANVRAHMPDSDDQDAFLQKIGILKTEGIDGVRFYHYGLIPRTHLEWIRRAMEVLG